MKFTCEKNALVTPSRLGTCAQKTRPALEECLSATAGVKLTLLP